MRFWSLDKKKCWKWEILKSTSMLINASCLCHDHALCLGKQDIQGVISFLDVLFFWRWFKISNRILLSRKQALIKLAIYLVFRNCPNENIASCFNEVNIIIFSIRIKLIWNVIFSLFLLHLATQFVETFVSCLADSQDFITINKLK